jgi:hypothetical protein
MGHDEENYRWDILISYAKPDRQAAIDLYNELESGCRVFLDVECLDPGSRFDEQIPRAQKSARITASIISSNTKDAYYQRDEIALAINLSRQDAAGHWLVPIYLNDPISLDVEITFGFNRIVGLIFTKSSGWPYIAQKLLDFIERIKSSSIGHPYARLGDSIEDRGKVFNDPDRLVGKTFAVELLNSPVIFTRDNNGKIRITISRRGVRDAVYNNAGKNWLIKNYLKDDIYKWAKEKDAEIHNFLMGRNQNPRYALGLDNFPLRWASGGVLSVIRINGKDGLWTPFFFRDISPIGWNIALGSSESDNELNNPSSLLMREFLEETLILPNKPDYAANQQVKTFVIMPDPINGFIEPRKQAEHFVDAHIDLRNQLDRLNLHLDQGAITCDYTRTNTLVEILDHQGNPQNPREWRNVLVCFNLLELGIEVVAVLEYDLKNTDYILDGEVIDQVDKESGQRWKELVRMPVALISHKFLKRVFSSQDFSVNYVLPEVITGENKAPSHRPPETPREDEIIIFPWDVKRRELIATSKPDSLDLNESDKKAIKRHRYWMKNFARYFLNDSGEPIKSNPVPWFTPASAKIMSYYFANQP